MPVFNPSTTVSVDNSTIELNAGALQVKANGITATQLADAVITFQGVWSVATTYTVDQAVQYKGGLFTCIAAPPSNEAPTNGTYWQSLVPSVGGNYRRIHDRGGSAYNATNFTSSITAVLLGLTDQPINVASGSGNLSRGALYLDPADYTAPASDLTLKLRYTLRMLTNSTSVGTVTFTPGLYPVTLGAGAANTGPHLTNGTVVSGSNTNTIVNPGTTANVSAVNEITFPAAGLYAMEITNSAALAANSGCQLLATLDYRWV